jgi:hypothetical protein
VLVSTEVRFFFLLTREFGATKSLFQLPYDYLSSFYTQERERVSVCVCLWFVATSVGKEGVSSSCVCIFRQPGLLKTTEE